MSDHSAYIGKCIQIPVHYDMWMRGARYGVVTAFRHGKAGYSDCLIVKLDKLPAKRLRVWRLDWPYIELIQGATTS